MVIKSKKKTKKVAKKTTKASATKAKKKSKRGETIDLRKAEAVEFGLAIRDALENPGLSNVEKTYGLTAILGLYLVKWSETSAELAGYMEKAVEGIAWGIENVSPLSIAFTADVCIKNTQKGSTDGQK